MLTHTEAKNILELVAPELTLPERLVAQGISLHESSYGSGWKEGHGAGSHNWGAIMRPKGDPGLFFETQDSRPGSGGPINFTGRFKVYANDDEGAADVVKVGLRENVKQAARAGDLSGVARAMFQNHYFTGTSSSPSANVLAYQNALASAIEKIVNETGEENPFPKGQAPGASSHGQASPGSSGGSLPTLRAGDSGEAVSLLRAILGRLERGAISPGSSFDSDTLRCLLTVQGTLGVKQDGICGPITWAKITEKLSEPPMIGYA